MAQDTDWNEQRWPCAYRKVLQLPFQTSPCALSEHSLFPVVPRDEEDTDSAVRYFPSFNTAPDGFKKLLGDFEG